MTTATIILEHICAGGGHLRFSGAIDAGAKKMIETTASDLQEPMTEEEMAAFIKGYVKLYKQGRTWAQVKTAFQTGVQVTL